MIDLVRRGQTNVYGQISDVVLKGNTWTNKAGAGDTSPQTVSNLDATKTYLLINDAGANITIDTIDTPTPVKLTGATEFGFEWASGKIALYELSMAEAALDAAVLGQKYHYVSGTKSTNSVRVKSVGKNLESVNYLAASSLQRVYGDMIKVNPALPLYGKQTLSATGRSVVKIYDANMAEIKTGNPFTTAYYYDTNAWVRSVDKIGIDTFTLSAGLGISYIRFGIYASSGSISAESRTVNQVDFTYEPYKESTITTPEIGRSLPNSVKDEFNVTTGVKTQNVSEDTLVSDTVYASLDTSTYTNVDVIKTTAFSLAKVGTTGADGQTHYYNKDGVELAEVAEADIDLEASAGKYYWGEDKKLYIIVAKGTYADIAAARTGLDATSLIYQLAEPVVTQLDPQPLTIFPNGTQYIEFGTKEVAEYADGIVITNTTIPIKTMVKVDKLHIENGHWKRTNIPLTSVTVAGDGLSFTITGAVNGDTYEYSYDYDSALSTMLDLEVGEPSLVTRNNRTIVL